MDHLGSFWIRARPLWIMAHGMTIPRSSNLIIGHLGHLDLVSPVLLRLEAPNSSQTVLSFQAPMAGFTQCMRSRYMYSIIYIYIYMYIYVCMYVCIYIYMCVCVFIYIYIYTYKYLYIYIYTCIHIYIHINICIYIYIYIYTHIYNIYHIYIIYLLHRMPQGPKAPRPQLGSLLRFRCGASVVKSWGFLVLSRGNFSFNGSRPGFSRIILISLINAQLSCQTRSCQDSVLFHSRLSVGPKFPSYASIFSLVISQIHLDSIVRNWNDFFSVSCTLLSIF